MASRDGVFGWTGAASPDVEPFTHIHDGGYNIPVEICHGHASTHDGGEPPPACFLGA